MAVVSDNLEKKTILENQQIDKGSSPEKLSFSKLTSISSKLDHENTRREMLAKASVLVRGCCFGTRGYGWNNEPLMEQFDALLKECQFYQQINEEEKKLWNEVFIKIEAMKRNSTVSFIDDLYIYPDTIEQIQQGSQITLGDLHGNSLKFIYSLIRHGIMQMSKEDYAKLGDLYKKEDPKNIKSSDLSMLDEILDRSKTNNCALLRLIGDEVGDRGTNDYFTIKILEKLKKEGVIYEIIFSNHGLEFLRHYGSNFDPNLDGFLNAGQANSVYNLAKLLERFGNDLLAPSKSFVSLLKECYFPFLKLLSYSVEEELNHITIYVHSVVGITEDEFDPKNNNQKIITSTIEAMALEANIPYNDKDIKGLVETIDKINRWFTEFLLKANTADKIIYKESYNFKYYPQNYRLSPIWRFAWLRENDGEASAEAFKRIGKKNGYTLSYVHGHTDAGTVRNTKQYNLQEYVRNLDNSLGCFLNPACGYYYIHYCFGKTGLDLKQKYEKENTKVQVELSTQASVSPKTESLTNETMIAITDNGKLISNDLNNSLELETPMKDREVTRKLKI